MQHSRLLERPLELVCKRGVITQKMSTVSRHVLCLFCYMALVTSLHNTCIAAQTRRLHDSPPLYLDDAFFVFSFFLEKITSTTKTFKKHFVLVVFRSFRILVGGLIVYKDGYQGFFITMKVDQIISPKCAEVVVPCHLNFAMQYHSIQVWLWFELNIFSDI